MDSKAASASSTERWCLDLVHLQNPRIVHQMREFTALAIIHLIICAKRSMCINFTCPIEWTGRDLRSTTLSFIFITFTLEAGIHHPEQ